MTTRESILAEVLKHQPEFSPLPDISSFHVPEPDLSEKYRDTFEGIGGSVVFADGFELIRDHIKTAYGTGVRVVSTLRELGPVAELCSAEVDPHSFADVELAIMEARLAVAENGAVWLTEDVMGQRILPYICQHLAVIVYADTIVSTMHDAYAKIASEDYGFGGFIGGPSKTADIEQALVMGAHGPLSMTVFLIKNNIPGQI